MVQEWGRRGGEGWRRERRVAQSVLAAACRAAGRHIPPSFALLLSLHGRMQKLQSKMIVLTESRLTCLTQVAYPFACSFAALPALPRRAACRQRGAGSRRHPSCPRPARGARPVGAAQAGRGARERRRALRSDRPATAPRGGRRRRGGPVGAPHGSPLHRRPLQDYRPHSPSPPLPLFLSLLHFRRPLAAHPNHPPTLLRVLSRTLALSPVSMGSLRRTSRKEATAPSVFCRFRGRVPLSSLLTTQLVVQSGGIQMHARTASTTTLPSICAPHPCARSPLLPHPPPPASLPAPLLHVHLCRRSDGAWPKMMWHAPLAAQVRRRARTWPQ